MKKTFSLLSWELSGIRGGLAERTMILQCMGMAGLNPELCNDLVVHGCVIQGPDLAVFG